MCICHVAEMNLSFRSYLASNVVKPFKEVTFVSRICVCELNKLFLKRLHSLVEIVFMGGNFRIFGTAK